MKRAVVIVVLLLSALSLARPVHASENMFTTTRLVDFASTIIRVGEDFGFHLYNYIVPSFQKVNENAYIDYEPYAVTMQEFAYRAEPGILRPNNKIIDWTTEVIRTALYGAILKASAPHGENVTSDECFISEGLQESSPVLFFPELGQAAKTVDSVYGLFTTTPENGVFNFDLPSLPLNGMNPNEDCKKHDIGEPEKPFGNDQVALSSFGNGSSQQVGIVATMLFDLFTTITETITLPDGTKQTKTTTEWEKENAKQEVLLTKKIAQRNNPELCHLGIQPCTPRNMNDNVPGLDKVGGVFSSFVSEKSKVIVPPNCVLEDEVTIVGFPAGKMENAEQNCNLALTGMGKGACTVVSGAENGKYQKVAVYGTTEKGVHIDKYCGAEEPVSCPIDVIKEKAQKPSDNKCSVSNAGGLASFMSADQRAIYGSGLSPLGIKVLETAAETYKVPASVILATMLHEGAFNHPWDWSSDEAIEKYSDCNNPSPMQCEQYAIFSGSKPPFGWIDNWWNGYITDGQNPYVGKYLKAELEGLDEVLKNVKTFSQCNFADSAFMMARAISEDYSHPVTTVPAVCIAPPPYGNIPMFTGATRPESCSSWTADRVATTRFQQGGGATIGTCTAADPANSFNIGHVIDIWQALTP